ncbi:outer membrane lipoprotein chaperone LolA [Aquisalimonas asiatica]|uniref:Outer-membrane lipoprotein carrier protein n=1 Tax=Aquisalimonas asiatica TaxID=406100 RepID=A0A1H8QBI6_9GAMM|nr:outer membrane lipoprotein chaperone LolA [Aquisalimonas asiatica]SEO51361.1 outer membrane lipoprotein carrier protein [Aquisalimonas asiatica]
MLRKALMIKAMTLLMLGFSSAVAADARAALESYFSEVENLEGDFEQIVRDEDGQVIEESQGTMAIQRPNRFDWVYEAPYAQRIVADGERLWIHDKDLQQVTVRPLQDTLGTGPALLLSGDLAGLEEQFSIEVADDGWVILNPRDDEWEVDGVRLRMGDGVPAEVVVEDGLGQKNQLLLHNVRTNASLDDNRFRFEPDDDMDVIEQGESRP